MTRLLDAISSPKELRALALTDLPQLCCELREAIIDTCARVGGHLGASLGAVELTVALHRVFKSPFDKIVFDVGHQAYAHKLLTGRAGRMASLRQAGGVAPFLDPTESPHDAFGAGHACTAVSVALGLLEAATLTHSRSRVVAVVGDGAMTGGLTFEGLNNAGVSRLPLTIVINDNQMSISRNVGAMPALLKSGAAREFFEAMGFGYLGPLDGHDLTGLLRAFEQVRRSVLPFVVHCRTQKGKGFGPAEADEATRGHAMGPYELRDGKLVRSRGGKRTFSEAFAAALEAVMEKNPKVVVVTPAMLEGSALGGLKARFPERVFDVGIAEQHAVAFAAGLAAGGLKPVCALYSTFLQRAYDQVIHDVVLPGLPVIFAIDRAGLVGADGATHQGSYDVAFLRPLPGLTQMAPVVGEDLLPMLQTALTLPGPCALRFPRGTLPAPGALGEGILSEQPVQGARWLMRASDAELTFVTLGPAGLWALEAARREARWSVLDARFCQPVDDAAFELAAASGCVVTVEEGTVHGGLGSAFLEFCARRGLSPRVRCLGLPDAFVRHGDARVQRGELGLSAEGLGHAARALLGREL